MTAGLPSRNLGYVQDMHSAGVLASALHIGINIQRTWVRGARGNVSAGVNWINVKLWFTRDKTGPDVLPTYHHQDNFVN